MDKIDVRAEHAHSHTGDDARERLLRLVKKIGDDYPSYGLTHEWTDPARTAIRFRFAKDGRGSGEGSAVLLEGRVTVELHALFKLPFFVPKVAAEWRVKDELAKSLKEIFG